MTLYRPGCGVLADAMAKISDVPDLAALAVLLRPSFEPFGVQINPIDIVIKPYGYDARIGWDTHMVLVTGT